MRDELFLSEMAKVGKVELNSPVQPRRRRYVRRVLVTVGTYEMSNSYHDQN